MIDLIHQWGIHPGIILGIIAVLLIVMAILGLNFG